MVKLGPPLPVTFTEQQLREIWERIREINEHQDGCCAFMMDKCHHNEEYERLYQTFRLAGAPDVDLPFTSPVKFEKWMASRRETP